MKFRLLSSLLFLSLSIARADDIADAKSAFATFSEYQKTDDIRILDLFVPNCTVIFNATDGNAVRSLVLKGDQVRGSLRQQIEKKRGAADVYENVKYTQEGAGVWVTAGIRSKGSDKLFPFSALYVRDQGGLKIKEMKISLRVDSLPAK